MALAAARVALVKVLPHKPSRDDSSSLDWVAPPDKWPTGEDMRGIVTVGEKLVIGRSPVVMRSEKCSHLTLYLYCTSHRGLLSVSRLATVSIMWSLVSRPSYHSQQPPGTGKSRDKRALHITRTAAERIGSASVQPHVWEHP